MASHRLDHVTAQPGLGTAGGAAVEDSRHAWLIRGLSRDSAPTCVRPEGG